MIVLGIDPGIAITGCAVVKKEAKRLTLIDGRALTSGKNLTTAERLNKLYTGITQVIKKFKPEIAALETLFFNTNVTTAFSVGQARGIVILSLAQTGIPIFEYNPMEVKIALTGYGRAKKMQLAKMVARILKLSKPPAPDDVADAAAIALTHLFSYKLKNSIK